jgi:zinc transporter ZupT
LYGTASTVVTTFPKPLSHYFLLFTSFPPLVLPSDREHNYLFTSLLIFAGIYCFYWSEKVLILITDYQKIRSNRQRIRKERTDMDCEDNDEEEEEEDDDRSVTRLVTPVSGISSKDQRDCHAADAAASARVPETSSPSVHSSHPHDPHDADRQPDGGGRRGFDGQSIVCSISQSCETSSVGQVGIDVSPGWRKKQQQQHQREEVDEQRRSRKAEGGDAARKEGANRQEARRNMPDQMTTTSVIRSGDMIADQERKDHLVWMVIIGDGIHNLIDGLSLGAALSDSHLTGFSIAIAILFEEVPHELGDYAILVSSGMTPRRAALCNLMSASTCYIGLVIGIICSDLSTSSSNSYIFAIAGGMFLYISIFNVMTDLNENFKTCRSISMSTAMEMLFWQNLGIVIGVYILYSLAQFDEKLLLQSLRIEL